MPDEKSAPLTMQVRRAPQRLAPGTILADRYRVIAWLGAGGMGSVYEVHDAALDELVALKLLHAELNPREDHRQRTRREVRLARRVSHPNVCRVHDIGQHAEHLFVTMELVRGRTLRSILRSDGVGSLARSIDLVVQVCAGLTAAHRAGVLHCDVKPDNVIVDDDRAVVTDFGIASLAELALDRRIAGTPSYIAPEVLLGDAFDQRIDVYATAVLAYELIADRRPFHIEGIDAAIERARTAQPIPSIPESAVPADTLTALNEVFSRALAHAPEHRTPTVEQLAEDIARATRSDGSQHYGPGSTASKQRGPAAASELLRSEDIATATAPPRSGTATQPEPAPRPAALPHRSEIRVATVLNVAFDCGEPLAGDDEADTLLDDLERVVVAIGGTPIDVQPGAIVASFGTPVALGDDAARAARAAFALLEKVDSGRAGLDTGRVLRRPVREGVASASGEALARAQELCERARPGELLASPAAARHLAGRYRVRDALSAAHPGGRALIVSPDEAETALFQRPPLVGRNRELTLLQRLFQDVCESRSPHFATVLGGAGFGKSRLRRELERQVNERRDVEWLVATATPFGEVAPLAILASADRRWHDAATCEGIGDQSAVYAAARRWLESRAAHRPVVLVLEDLHWADQGSIEFLQLLRRTLAQVPVFVLALARPTLLERVPSWTAADAPDVATQTVVELGPLGREPCAEIARHVAPNADADEIAQLALRADGNPFFAEELARDLRERGPRSSNRPGLLPDTIEAAIQARLDRLPDRERDVLRAAAVVGREFWRTSCLAALVDQQRDERELDDALAELERRSIVFALAPSVLDDDRYAFRNELIRDVAYQQLAPRERQRIHEAVAHFLERSTRADRGEPPAALLAVIAQHRDAGGDRELARAAYRRAGVRSLAVFAFLEASQLLTRALELTDEPDAELCELLGDALRDVDIQQATCAFEQALELVTDEPNAAAQLCAKLGRCAQDAGAPHAQIVHWLQRGLAYLERDGMLAPSADRATAASLYGSLGWVVGYRLGDNQRALVYGERAVALLEGEPKLRRELAQALSALGGTYMRLGRWRDQKVCNERTLQIAQECGDLPMQITGHCNLGIVLWSLGEIGPATEHTLRAVELTVQTGQPAIESLMRNNLAGLLLEDDRHEEAEAQLAECLRLSSKTGHLHLLGESYVFAARARFAAGDLYEAEEHARRAIEISKRDGSTIFHGTAERVLGSVLSHRGDDAGATAAFARAYELLGGGVDDFEYARTQAAEARQLNRRGQPGDRERAAALRDEARAAFARVGAARELTLLDDDEVVR